ncbi:MAG: DUF4430 domain-containing protein [Solirubrobacterales bacterium]
MTAGRGLAGGAALALAALLAGCGFGAGASTKGTAILTVTRDYGTREMVRATDTDPPESDTVIRLLDRSAEITTRYGGGFVQSIGGLAGGVGGGRSSDWFFYVNGVESSVGAGDVRVHAGDRIWWDYRDWTDAMSVPAVVGSWPQPFLHAASSAGGEAVRVECLGAATACKAATGALRAAGVRPAVDRAGAASSATPAAGVRVLVGPWARIRGDHAVDGLRGGPAASGVFASFEGPVRGAYHLIALDPAGKAARDLGPRAGLVAVVRQGDGPVTWIITGSGEPAVRSAAGLLGERSLRNRYAVGAPRDGGAVALPLQTAGAR